MKNDTLIYGNTMDLVKLVRDCGRTIADRAEEIGGNGNPMVVVLQLWNDELKVRRRDAGIGNPAFEA